MDDYNPRNLFSPTRSRDRFGTTAQPGTRNWALKQRQKRHAQQRELMECRRALFFDALWPNVSVVQAAKAAGISTKTGFKYLREVSEHYGWQAS